MRNGGIDYVSDPSSAHFSDAPIPKLVRELIQNSLDAKEDGLRACEPDQVPAHPGPAVSVLFSGSTMFWSAAKRCNRRAKGRWPTQV